MIYKPYYRREFLNLKHGTALIEADLNRHTANITIGDCSRLIHLEFDYHSEKAYKRKLNKIETIISVLTEFRQAMLDNPPEPEEPDIDYTDD